MGQAPSKLARIIRMVDNEVTPTASERRRISALAGKLKGRVEEEVRKRGLQGEVRVEGSLEKDTWLRGDADVDIFILTPKETEREQFAGAYLQAARASLAEYSPLERYAEHPYLEARIADGVKVNIVPCYKVEPQCWKSATDRTPYHTNYVKRKLRSPKKRREVRLLKKFMKGIEVYGADIKVGGFSGYLAELLTINYGDFLSTLKSASRWRVGETLDPGNLYEGRVDEDQRLFNDPLVVVDPVDRLRNVASPVSLQSFNHFRAASKFFLRRPDIIYFNPPQLRPMSASQIHRLMLSRRRTAFLILKLGRVEAVPDILWGQLYKTERAIQHILEQFDFKVLRSKVWSNETDLNVLLFELESVTLGKVKKHSGPPTLSAEEDRFIAKYLGSKLTVAGPYIEKNRWFVHILRRYTDARALLKEKLADHGRSIGVASRVAEAVGRSLSILVNEEILDFYLKCPAFALFLTRFLQGKPSWWQG